MSAASKISQGVGSGPVSAPVDNLSWRPLAGNGVKIWAPASETARVTFLFHISISHQIGPWSRPYWGAGTIDACAPAGSAWSSHRLFATSDASAKGAIAVGWV